MRIATAFAQYASTTAMLAQQSALHKTQMQLSTGDKILAPSDNPSGSVRAQDLQISLDAVKQYGNNITYLKEKLGGEESALQGGLDVLHRARELTVQALNGTNTPEDRKAIGQEIEQLRDQLFSIANTRDAHGEYLFAGVRSQTTPFIQGPAQAPAYGYTFQADASSRELQMSATRRLSIGDSGFDLFQDIPSSSVTATANNGKQNVLSTLNLLTNALKEGQVQSGAAGVIGADLGAVLASPAGLVVSTGVNDTLKLSIDGGTPGSIDIPPGSYKDVNDLVSAINGSIDNGSLSGAVRAYAYGNSVQFVSSSSGNQSSVAVSDSPAPTAAIGFNGGETGVGRQHPATGTLTANTPGFPINYGAPTPFDIAVDNGPNVTVNVPPGSYADVNAFVAGINAGFTAAGIDSQVKAQANGNNVELVSTSTSDNAKVQVFTAGTSTFLDDAGFTSGQASAGSTPLHVAMSDFLADLDSAIGRFTETDASVGARLKTLDTQTDVHSRLTLDMQSALSDTKDLDYAEAISRFSLEQMALQAAQQSFVKVQGLTLFDYIR